MMRVCAVFVGLNRVPLLFRPGWRFESQGIHGFTPSFRSKCASSARSSSGCSIQNCIAWKHLLRSCRDRPCAQVCQLHLPFAVFRTVFQAVSISTVGRVGSVKDAEVGADLLQDLGEHLAWDDIRQAIRHSSGSRGRFLVRTSLFRL
jgi:hypothetical protein